MTDRHYTDDELDHMAREKEHAMYGGLRGHLRVCAACREKLSFLIDFYAMVGEELRKAPYPHIAEIITPVPSLARSFQLHHFRPSPDLASLGIREPSMLLAAQTVSETISAYVTVATYTSERDRALVRITKKAGSDEYQLNLVTPGDQPAGRALVSLAGTPKSIPPILTGEDGSSAFALDGEVAWESLTVLASLPIARVPVQTPLTDGLELADRNVSLLFSVLESGLRLTVRGTASVGHAALVSSSGRQQVVRLRDGIVAFSQPWDTDTGEILLFP